MKLQQCPSLRGKERACKIGLSSSRFSQSHMGENAETDIRYVKRKDREQLKSEEWCTLKYYATDATKQLMKCEENIAREHTDSLSMEEFVDKYESQNLPVVIDGCAKTWKTDIYWTHQHFYEEYKDVKFKVGQDDEGYKLRIPFKYFMEYLVYNKDDSPLYLFESSLENNSEMKPILQRYTVPTYFQDDILKYAGEQDRPPYRWFLMGPQRSGTTIHIDPLSTSAWNTSLAGHKRWVIFPNEIPKFIVKGKKFRGRGYVDEAINYFVEILPKIIDSEGRQRLGIIEFIQRPGETVFVPGGWWHAVINLDDTIAVTQNVMTHQNFDSVWRSIRCERRKFAQRFLKSLHEKEPNLYQRAVKLNDNDKFSMGDKYEQQSVSLSFTPTESSSSSSSDEESSASKSSQPSKRSKSLASKKSLSRSRTKHQRKKSHTLSHKHHKHIRPHKVEKRV